MNINIFSLLVVSLVPMIIGFFWYGPLFGKAWMTLAKVSPKDIDAKKSEMPKMYGLMFLSSMIMVYVLSQFVQYSRAKDAISGAMVGFWAWVGFVATVKLGDVLWNGTPLNLYYLDVAYRLVSMIAMGAILGMWR